MSASGSSPRSSRSPRWRHDIRWSNGLRRSICNRSVGSLTPQPGRGFGSKGTAAGRTRGFGDGDRRRSGIARTGSSATVDGNSDVAMEDGAPWSASNKSSEKWAGGDDGGIVSTSSFSKLDVLPGTRLRRWGLGSSDTRYNRYHINTGRRSSGTVGISLVPSE